MKLNVALGLLLLAVLAAGGAVYLKRHLNAPPPAPVAAAPAPNTVSGPASLPRPSPIVSVAPARSPALTPEERQAAIDAEIDRLLDWARNNDPQSLSNILADLNNPDKDVREAAIEAAKQFGSTNAIPALKAAAMNSTDTDEQMDMLEAASFLALPSINDSKPTPEQIAEGQKKAAQAQAARQARIAAAKQAQAQQQGNAAASPASPSPQP